MGRITVLKLDNENKVQVRTEIFVCSSGFLKSIIFYALMIDIINVLFQPKQENWLPYFQYQSHDPEFDFLKSLEIEAKINQIKFCDSAGNKNLLLSANGKIYCF